MSRRLRSILPTTTLQLKPQVTPQSAVQARREKWQQRQKQHYNRSAKPLPTLHIGAPIRFQQDDGKWKPATVIKPAETPRSYHIKTSTGQIFRRNRRHLLDTNTDHRTSTIHQPEISEDDLDSRKGEQQPSQSLGHELDHPEPCLRTRYGRTIKPRQVMDL